MNNYAWNDILSYVQCYKYKDQQDLKKSPLIEDCGMGDGICYETWNMPLMCKSTNQYKNGELPTKRNAAASSSIFLFWYSWFPLCLFYQKKIIPYDKFQLILLSYQVL